MKNCKNYHTADEIADEVAAIKAEAEEWQEWRSIWNAVYVNQFDSFIRRGYPYDEADELADKVASEDADFYMGYAIY